MRFETTAGPAVVTIAESTRAPERLTCGSTALSAPPHVDEFDLAGLTKTPSQQVRPPRVAASPSALECLLHNVIPVGDSFIVLGRVVCAWVDEDVLDNDRPREWNLDPVARLSGSRYVTYGETVTLRRPE